MPVGGGDINEAWRFDGDDASWFVKLNVADRLDMFEAEREALDELARADAVRVPRPLCLGRTADHAFLVLEHLDLRSPDGASDVRLGRNLARQHRQCASRFGWHRDNTIGTTPQANAWLHDWPTFWRERRLLPQLELAAQNGHPELRDRAAPLLEHLDDFFAAYMPQPSLLHGDLWSGNYCRVDDMPVIFDPATYYGDREADIAMTELFGRFGGGFYDGYRAEWPLDAGYTTRRDLYNLYHILNHLNLFGGAYAGSAERLIERLSALC